MVQGIRLRTKLICGFLLVLLLTGLVAYVGYGGLNAVADRVDKSHEINQMILLLRDMADKENNYTASKDEAAAAAVMKDTGELRELVQRASERFKDPRNLRRMEQLLEAVNHYERAFNSYKATRETAAALALRWKEIGQRHTSIIDKAQQRVSSQAESVAPGGSDKSKELRAIVSESLSKDVIQPFLMLRVRATYCLKDRTKEAWREFTAALTHCNNRLTAWHKITAGMPALSETVDEIRKGLEEYARTGEEYQKLFAREAVLESERAEAKRSIEHVWEACFADQAAKIDERIASATRIMTTAAIVAIAAGMILAFILTRSITRPIHRIIEGLKTSADRIALNSNQLSSASRQLAEGSSEQASALEETSASMEEMTSITRENAERAERADEFTHRAEEVVDRTGSSVHHLADAMTDILRAAEETHRIISTIDEIAFRTNLLALNAAVEAARAGTAGSGFAVVAEEVRSLALRSAEAAGNTSSLLDLAMDKVREGVTSVDQIREEFASVSDFVKELSELVRGISAASQEQRAGIEQINRAVAEMDMVTQQNASNAEETASASREMGVQSERLKNFVGELTCIVGTLKKGSTNEYGLTENRPWKIHSGPEEGKTRLALIEGGGNPPGSIDNMH